jgi:hypothetical protein
MESMNIKGVLFVQSNEFMVGFDNSRPSLDCSLPIAQGTKYELGDVVGNLNKLWSDYLPIWISQKSLGLRTLKNPALLT